MVTSGGFGRLDEPRVGGLSDIRTPMDRIYTSEFYTSE